MINRNVGSADRIVRILLGLVLIGLCVTERIGPWGWIGLIPLGTGLVGVCPAYLPFGFNTCASSARR